MRHAVTAHIDEVRNLISSQQADFCDTTIPCAKTIVGAKGSGKTYIGARFVAKMVDSMPGSKGIFASPTNRQTEDIWEQDIKALLDELGWHYLWNQTKGIIRFWNGTVLHLRSAESPERIESIQYHWGWQDEVSLAKQDFCKTIMSRIRALDGTGHARFTSMPDDPDEFIYDYLESVCESFHEVTLYDNPNQNFVKAYEKQLKEIYSGAELDRLLYAKRVSLSGLGLFAANQEHRDSVEYDPAEDLYLVWDFNVEYRAVTAYQQVGVVGNRPMYNCIESFQLKNYTTKEDAEEMCRRFRKHEARIFLHGDASGENRSAQTSDSMWNQIRKVFNEKFPGQVRFVVPRSNPNVKDTIQVTNWALRNNLLYFSDKAKIAYRYLVAAKADKYGEIDKSNDYNEGGAKSHEVDTIRYFCWKVFEPFFPGRESRKVTTTKLKGF